ncbi:hypothetical protein D9619_010519 [Psilocybe cf. subviscida]|uniref:Uncharacterized protein n=1 Tax=Psilocybe cf. subviscida TaxID=2480587 RepID=A0A8H5ASX0_9AGAR|nr:hypothetical protein D9619_010519 [Psilocybe cf. subviscida]
MPTRFYSDADLALGHNNSPGKPPRKGPYHTATHPHIRSGACTVFQIYSYPRRPRQSPPRATPRQEYIPAPSTDLRSPDPAHGPHPPMVRIIRQRQHFTQAAQLLQLSRTPNTTPQPLQWDKRDDDKRDKRDEHTRLLTQARAQDREQLCIRSATNEPAQTQTPKESSSQLNTNPRHKSRLVSPLQSLPRAIPNNQARERKSSTLRRRQKVASEGGI